MENEQGKDKKRFYSILYPWLKKPATEEEDLEKRLKQLRGVNSVMAVMIIGFFAASIITAQWAGLILVIVFLFFFFVVREERKQLEARLEMKEKK